MTWKRFRLATAGLVGCALIAPFCGCSDEAQTKPTIDTTTPIKAPGAPTTHKVEVQKKPG
jgi:hypothetical protein